MAYQPARPPDDPQAKPCSVGRTKPAGRARGARAETGLACGHTDPVARQLSEPHQARTRLLGRLNTRRPRDGAFATKQTITILLLHKQPHSAYPSAAPPPGSFLFLSCFLPFSHLHTAPPGVHKTKPKPPGLHTEGESGVRTGSGASGC